MAPKKQPKKEDPLHIGNPLKYKRTDSRLENLVKNQKAKDQYKLTGIGCTHMLDATPVFNKAECEYEIKYANLNCGIVLGRDRPNDKLSGYGGSGVKRSSAIDIVAGRLGPEAASTNDKDEIIICENNFTLDAARIYVSQRTNIDQNFKIRDSYGLVEPSVGLSGIGIKADCVRIIGRKDIKIVTGTDFYDSRNNEVGVTYKVPQKIMLIGDNRSDLIQPMVKGNNVQELLIKIMDCIHNVTSTINNFILHQNEINMAAINHTHRERWSVNEFGFFSEDLWKHYSSAIKLTTEIKPSLLEIDAKLTAIKAKHIFMPDNPFNVNDQDKESSAILSSYNYCN